MGSIASNVTDAGKRREPSQLRALSHLAMLAAAGARSETAWLWPLGQAANWPPEKFKEVPQ
jgi:hypothetical protein